MARLDLNKALLTAARRTVNKLIRKAKTVGVRSSRELYNIKAKDLNRSIKLSRARGSRLEATIQVRGGRIKVYYFGAKQTRKGVTVRIRRDRGRKLIRSAFIQTMPTGSIGVFRRKKGARLPIETVTTISAAQMFEQAAVEAIEKMLKADGSAIMQHEIEFELGKYKR